MADDRRQSVRKAFSEGWREGIAVYENLLKEQLQNHVDNRSWQAAMAIQEAMDTAKALIVPG
jgi:hypothetical protein